MATIWTASILETSDTIEDRLEVTTITVQKIFKTEEEAKSFRQKCIDSNAAHYNYSYELLINSNRIYKELGLLEKDYLYNKILVECFGKDYDTYGGYYKTYLSVSRGDSEAIEWLNNSANDTIKNYHKKVNLFLSMLKKNNLNVNEDNRANPEYLKAIEEWKLENPLETTERFFNFAYGEIDEYFPIIKHEI